MNPREQEDSAFDDLADGQMRKLERALDAFDPDEVETNLAGDVMTLTLGNGGRVVINRHRAARQIWMAAGRRAWHFNYDAQTGTWRTTQAELIGTLEQALSEQLQRPVKLTIDGR